MIALVGDRAKYPHMLLNWHINPSVVSMTKYPMEDALIVTSRRQLPSAVDHNINQQA